MKIFFYTELHPIRESHTTFYLVASQIISMMKKFKAEKELDKNLDFKILLSNPMINELKKYNDLPQQSEIISLKEYEHKKNEKYFTEWNNASIDVWKDLMLGRGKVTFFYLDVLERIYQNEFDFDVIVYWGTNGAVKNFAKKYNLTAVSIELGCTRVPFFESIYFDFIGVNGASYTHEIDIEKINFKKSDFDIFSLIEQKNSYKEVFTKYTNNFSKNINKNILIPLQLADDANIILYSKYNSMLDFLQDVLPRLIDKGYYCFIKPHPLNINSKYNSNDHKKCKLYSEKFDNAFWLDDVSYYDYMNLLAKIHCVIVVNSSVGFESMLLNKLVVSMGESPYNISSKLPTFDDFLNKKIDLVSYEKTIKKIVLLLLSRYLFSKNNIFEIKNFLEAIKINKKLKKFFIKDKEIFQKYINDNTIIDMSHYKDFLFLENYDISLFNKYMYVYYKKIYNFLPINLIKKIPWFGKIIIYVKNNILKWR